MESFSESFTLVERQASHQVYDDYEQAYSGTSFDIDLQLRSFLRKQYPNHVLTVTPESNVSLLYYAAAGKAFAKVDLESENALKFRGYLRGSQPGAGSMAESYRFAKYDYRALDEDFVLYYVQLGLYMFQYILKEIGDGESVTGHSKLTDALLAAVGEFQRPKPISHDVVYVYDGYWTASSKLFEQVRDATWDDVILDPKMKKALVAITGKFFDSKEVYDNLGVPWKRGILMHGPPGNGKTISIKALMHTLRYRKLPIPSLYVKSAKSTYNIRTVFQFARQMAPCMLVLEDIDTIVTPQTRSYYFNEVDGLEDNSGLLVVGTTNHLDQLDPGLSKRPSRFDRKYFFPLPSQTEREQYCTLWQVKVSNMENDIDFPKKLCPPMAELLDGFSFAYMKEAFVSTLLAIAGDQSEDVEGSGGGDECDDLDGFLIWREFKKQVKILRDDMDSSESSTQRLAGHGRLESACGMSVGAPDFGWESEQNGKGYEAEKRLADSTIQQNQREIVSRWDNDASDAIFRQYKPERDALGAGLVCWKDGCFGEDSAI